MARRAAPSSGPSRRLSGNTGAYPPATSRTFRSRKGIFNCSARRRSSDPGGGYEYDTLSDDLGAVLDQLDLRSASLVGHSMGCGTIIRYLTRRGASRVKQVVLVSPTMPFLLKTKDNPQGIDGSAFERLRSGWAKDFSKWVSDNARPFFAPETSDSMVEWGVSMVRQASLKALIDCNRADAETDFRSELPKITVPTLI